MRADVVAELRARPAPPKLPATRQQVADWVDRLRADAARKRAIGWELVRHVAECRAPIAKLQTSEKWVYSETLLAKK